ncbi:MAG: DHA2 family efflux MFS transporter permease subunit [Acuticoccus sp.]
MDRIRRSATTTSSARDWVGIFFVCLGLGIVTADLSIVDAVRPQIVEAFGISGHLASFIISVYMLVSACLLIPAGKLADQIGSRRVFFLGMLIFATGSLVCGLSPNYPLFLVGRLVQATGYAMTFPAALAMVNFRFPSGPRRTLAFAIVALSIGAALGAGPMMGGIVAQAGNWHFVFTTNVPLALVAGIGCFAAVPAHAAHREAHGFDALGLVLLVAGQMMLFGGLQFGARAGWLSTSADFTLLGYAWPLPVSPALLLVAATLIFAAMFVRRERRRGQLGRDVIVDISIFDNRAFSCAFVAASAMTAGVFGFLYVLPLFVEYVLGQNLLGSLVALMGLGMVLGALASSPLLKRYRRSRVTFAAMLLQLAAPLAAAGFLHDPMPLWLFVPGLLLQGAGWSLAYAVLQNTMLSNVRPDLAAMASGTGLMGRLLAGAMMTTLIASVLFLTATIATRDLDMRGLTDAQTAQIEEAYRFSSVLKVPAAPAQATATELSQIARFRAVVKEVKADMVLALRLGLLVIAVINFCGLIATLWIWHGDDREGPAPAPPPGRILKS